MSVHRFPLQKTDASTTTPEELVGEVLRDLEERDGKPTGLIVLWVEEVDGGFVDHFYMCGPSCNKLSRVVGWLEYFKSRFLASMGANNAWEYGELE